MTFPRTTPTKEITGLDRFKTANTWILSNDLASFAACGITITARIEGVRWVADFQYDYKNPDNIDSLDYQKSGTYGCTLFGKTLDEIIKACEDKMNSPFEGLVDYMTSKVTKPKKEITIYQLAKKALFHHFAKYDVKGDDFRWATLNSHNLANEDDKELFTDLCILYQFKEISDKKYSEKLALIFEKEFDQPLTKYLDGWKFKGLRFFNDYESKVKKHKDISLMLPPYKAKVIKRIMSYYSV